MTAVSHAHARLPPARKIEWFRTFMLIRELRLDMPGVAGCQRRGAAKG
ncbi:hypothetical protein DB31_2850 [Hyalangium minutum]|uniref:Uncharacterized protein n=1 Tax=Hyalangium minutum TaxID=394096 RepID=A0A085W6E4_9BACT|nr:hypothetical protein DB31_2850 [Hyalangium minutum]